MEPDRGPQSGEGPAVGVCYVTATAPDNGDVSTLRVRIELTHNVGSEGVTTCYAVGPDAASEILRTWMTQMCTSG